jgi:prepilin-type N-terminal cleavage/methylation domain-containing protein
MIKLPRQPDPAGFTLLEMLVSLVIIAIVGAGVSSMMFAMANSVDYERQQRSALVKLRVLDTRVTGSIRAAQAVLDVGDDYIVLWTGDTRINGLPNLSELQRIERTAGNEVWSYRGSPAIAADADTQYELEDDFGAITQSLKGSAGFPAERWCDNVTGWTVQLDQPDVLNARLVHYQITVQYEDHTETGSGAASMRSK